MANSRHDSDSERSEEKPGWLQVVGSVLAAGFGVQSSKNRERDFKHGSARNYLIAGALFTVLFVVAVYSLVQLVLDKVG